MAEPTESAVDPSILSRFDAEIEDSESTFDRILIKEARNFYLKGQERLARSALPKEIRDNDVFSALPEAAKYEPAEPIVPDRVEQSAIDRLAHPSDVGRTTSSFTSPKSVFDGAPPSGQSAEEQQKWMEESRLRLEQNAKDRQALRTTQRSVQSDHDWDTRLAEMKGLRKKAIEKSVKDEVQKAHHDWHKRMLIATHGGWDEKNVPIMPVPVEAEKYMVESLAAGNTNARHIFTTDVDGNEVLDEDVYKVLNNYARKELGREYATPAELAEFFAEDHKRKEETHDRSMAFLSEAMSGLPEATVVDIEDAYTKMMAAERAYEEADASNKKRAEAELRLRQSDFVSIYEPAQEKAAAAERRPGIVGILPEAKQFTNKMPLIEDREVESHIADLLSPGMAERTLLEMNKDNPEYLQMVSDGVRVLIDMPRETKVQLFGAARGNQLEDVYSFFQGKVVGDDLMIPLGYDPTVERAPLDFRHHEDAIKGYAYVHHIGEIIKREGPLTGTREERQKMATERDERAEKYAEEKAKAAVVRAQWGQKAPYFTRDPDRVAEKFLNGESLLGAVANASGFMYDLLSPSGQIQRHVMGAERSLEAGVMRNVYALMLPYRKIGGKVYVDGEGRYSVAPGFSAEMLGEKWAPLDTVFRVLGPFSEGIGAAYRVALRELMDEAPNAAAAHDKGFGKDLVARMAEKMRDSDEVVIAMTETTDNVGPLLMGLPRSLFGSDPKTQIPRTMFGLGMFAGLIIEPGPIEAVIVAKHGTAGLRFKDPIRTKLGLTTTTELTRGLEAIKGKFGSADDIRNLTVEQLGDIDLSLRNLARGDKRGGVQVAVRTVRNEAMMGINQTTSRAAADMLQQAIDQASAFTKSADEIANRARNTANTVYMERVRAGVTDVKDVKKTTLREVEADIEKVLLQANDTLTPDQVRVIQDDFILDVQEQVYRLKAHAEIVDAHRNVLEVLKMSLADMKAMEEIFGQGATLSKPVTDILKAFETMADPKATTRARKKAVGHLAQALDVKKVSKPKADGVYDLGDVFSYINDVLVTRQVKVDDLARRVRELWPGGLAGRKVAPAIRAERAKIREEITDILMANLAHGDALGVATTAAKIDTAAKKLAVSEAQFAKMGGAAIDWLGTAGRAVESFGPALAKLPGGLGTVAQKLLKGLEDEVLELKVKISPEALELQAARALRVKEAVPALKNHALEQIKTSLINNMQLLEILKTDPTVLKRIAQTSRLGWLVDQTGGVVRVGDKAGEEIRVTDWEAIVKLEDAQFEALVTAFRGADVTDQQKAAFIAELFKRGSYMVHMFETPTGKLFKGAKGGMRSYAQMFAGSGVEIWDRWLRGLYQEPRATYFWTMAQFRPGGRMYGFSSFFQKTLGINSVGVSTRWELFGIRQQTRLRNIVQDVTRLVKFRTEDLLQRGDAPMDIVEQQRAMYREAMTTTDRITLVDPRTTHVVHDLTAFISEDSIIRDAVKSILFSAHANPQAVQATKAWGPDSLNTESAFWAVLEAFLPDRADVRAGARVANDQEWQNWVIKYHTHVIEEITKEFATKIDDLGDAALYDGLLNTITNTIDGIFGSTKGASAAMTAKAENLKLYHDGLILTAAHNRAAKAMVIELGNFNPTMARSANALLSDTFDVNPFQTVPLQVGDIVVPVRKIERFNEILVSGSKVTVATVDDMRALDGSLARKGEDLVKDGLDFARVDDVMGRAEGVGAKPLKRAYVVGDAFRRLDTTEGHIIEFMYKAGDTLPDGTVVAKGDKPFAKLTNIEDAVPLDEITRQSDHYTLSFLDGLEGLLTFGMRNIDDALSETDTQKFLTMRSRIDSMAQQFIIHSYNPKNPNNPVLMPKQFFSYFEDVIENTRKLTHTAAKNNPTAKFIGPLYDRYLSFAKDVMLLGFMGTARLGMLPVQFFGDLFSMAVTVDRVPSMAKVGMGGALGYMGNRVAKAWDELALKLEAEAASKGRTWLAPMVVSLMNPTLARVLTADPKVTVKWADGSTTDARTAFRMMSDDVGNTSIVSEGAGKLLAKQSQRLAADLDGMTQSFLIKAWDHLMQGAPASKYKGVRAADKVLFMTKRMIRQSVETGTLRTRQAQWVDTMQNVSANRNVARDRLNYALINWTSDMRQWDMEILSRVAIFPTFQKGYLRQGFLSMFDAPSTNLGQYINRHMRLATGPQRMEMWYRVVEYSRDRFLQPMPGQGLDEKEAREMAMRGEYPEYNFDRVMTDFGKLDRASQEIFAGAKVPRTHQYRVLPGVQSLLFYKTIAEVSLLMGAMLSYGASTVGLADREVSTPGVVDLLGEFIGNFAWDHISHMFDYAMSFASGDTMYKSYYGPKLTIGEAEAMSFLGQGDIILPDRRGAYRLNPQTDEGYITFPSALRYMLVMGLREASMLKDFHRAASVYGILDPDSPAAPVSVRQMVQQYEDDVGDWRARFDSMLNVAGILERRFLHLENGKHFSIERMKKQMQLREAIWKQRSDEAISQEYQRTVINVDNEDELLSD